MYLTRDINFICLSSSSKNDEFDPYKMLKDLGFIGNIQIEGNEDDLMSSLSNTMDFDFIIINQNDNEELNKTVSLIKALDNYKTTPILVTTNITTNEVMYDCFRAGVSEYVVKPFSKETLAARILNSWNSLKS